GALRTADQRMYELKAGRASASRQSTDVLLRVLNERSPGIGEHLGEVSDLAMRTAEHLGLPEHEVKRIELAAELPDVGKVAIAEVRRCAGSQFRPDVALAFCEIIERSGHRARQAA